MIENDKTEKIVQSHETADIVENRPDCRVWIGKNPQMLKHLHLGLVGGGLMGAKPNGMFIQDHEIFVPCISSHQLITFPSPKCRV